MNSTLQLTSITNLIEPEYESDNLSHQWLSKTDSRILKDMRINLQNTFQSQFLNGKETSMIALGIAVNEKNEKLIREFSTLAHENEATENEISEAIACATLLAANNVLYRFRHFMGNEKYDQIPARIKMQIMVNPVLGKELFELISLAVSAVNGCEKCVKSHEHSLIQMGSSEERIFDSIRLSAIIVSLSKMV